MVQSREFTLFIRVYTSFWLFITGLLRSYLFFMTASRASYDFFRASFRSASIPRSMTRSSAA